MSCRVREIYNISNNQMIFVLKTYLLTWQLPAKNPSTKKLFKQWKIRKHIKLTFYQSFPSFFFLWKFHKLNENTDSSRQLRAMFLGSAPTLTKHLCQRAEKERKKPKFHFSTTHGRGRSQNKNINIIPPQKSYKWIFQQQKNLRFTRREINDIFFVLPFIRHKESWKKVCGSFFFFSFLFLCIQRNLIWRKKKK